MGIEPHRWGKDHWSTFAYIETRCVDYRGRPNAQHIQTNHDRHPLMGNLYDGADYGIRLADCVLPGDEYDEWDCLDDLETYGLIDNVGTGLHRQYEMTATGKLIAGQLRAHKADQKNYVTFQPRWADVPVLRVKILEGLRI